MTFRVEFTDVAEKEVQDILFWILGQSPEWAGKWQCGLESAIHSLTEFPGRCPRAPEDTQFAVTVRQLLYGSYRILFTLVDSDGDSEVDTVRILHVRHGARRRLGNL